MCTTSSSAGPLLGMPHPHSAGSVILGLFCCACCPSAVLHGLLWLRAVMAAAVAAAAATAAA
eukprot:3387055-Pyramimonas_sp.AAC.1